MNNLYLNKLSGFSVFTVNSLLSLIIKRKFILTLGIAFLLSSNIFSQIDLDDCKVLKIGYKVGYTGFKPAYFSLANGSETIKTQYKDHIYTTNWDVWFGKYDENIFYDANIGGLIYITGIYIYDLAKDKNPLWLNEKFRKAPDNLKQNGEVARGTDFDIIDMKMGFGGKGIFGGFQFGYTSIGSSYIANLDKDSSRVSSYLNPYWFFGLGAHYNVKIKDLITQNSITYDWLAKKYGKCIKIESVISLGDDNGFYAAPYIKLRWIKDERVKGSIYAMGIRIGAYISESN